MKPLLLSYLCDPNDKSDLLLRDATYASDGEIIGGVLISKSGNKYPIVDGIPRFVGNGCDIGSVQSFGNEWNYFNFDQFKMNWLNHTVRNTFGSTDAFRGKVIVDAGAGSGMQSKWMSEAGAEYVISLEMSHSVDGVMKKNLQGLKTWTLSNVQLIALQLRMPP